LIEHKNPPIGRFHFANESNPVRRVLIHRYAYPKNGYSSSQL